MSGSALGSVARIALTVGGAYFGGPVGGVIGSIAGNLLFPEKLPGVSGPRLGDQQFTSSTEGTAIPLVYGQHVVNGNFIWAAPLEEVVNTEEQGGKGGPTQEVTTYTYFLSFAVGLCEGTITGIPRILENGKIIYDRRPQQDGESNADYTARLAASDELDEQMTIYYGDETQLPDPLIESHEGVGEVTAHRGLAYVVFERRDVTDFGGRPAQYQFEVTRAELVYTPTTELASAKLLAWASENNASPLNPGNDHEFSTDGFTTIMTLAQAYDALEASAGYSFDSGIIAYSETGGPFTGGVSADISSVGGFDPQELIQLQLHVNKFLPLERFEELPERGGIPACPTYLFEFPTDEQWRWWTRKYDDDSFQTVSGTAASGIFQTGAGAVDDLPDAFRVNLCDENFSTNNPLLATHTIQMIPDRTIAVRRIPSAPELPGSDLPDWPDDPDEYWWDPETSVIYSKAPWIEVAGDYLWLGGYGETGTSVSSFPASPVIEQTDPDNNEANWTAIYNVAVLAGDQPPGKTYQANGLGDPDLTYPIYHDYAYTRTYTAVTYAGYAGITVGSIVREQCERSGLTNETDFDVSELTRIIPGYKVGRIMNGRDIIAPLRQYALFDGLETDKLYFPLRGGDIVATLTDDDLGAHEFGGTVPPLVEANRIEDVELPYAVRVRYADIDSEYQAGAQLATMKVTAGKSAVDIETTIAMDATAAIQMAEIIQQESVQRREDYGLNIGPHLLALTATDPILIPLRGELQRVVITEDTRQLPGIIEAKAVRDDASIYTSTATGTAGGAGEQTLVPIGDTDLVLIDSAALTSGSNDAGMFVAACGASDRWRGFGLFESTDGGSNYSRIAAYTVPATMGTLIDAVPEGPFDLWDYANSFTVAMDNGTLESRTQEEVTNGANAIFVGADGRWEVMQFADAVAEGVDGQGRTIYRLSTLLRGRQGTEWAIGTSQVGDRLALCVTTQRLAMEVARVGTERLFKAVSFGRTTESGPTQNITPQGVALKPYAPTLPEGQRDGSNNLDIYAVRRTRISGEWMDSDYVPLNEEIEAYEVDILDGASPETVLRTLSGTSFPIAYTAAQQTTDFGAPQVGIRVRIYQISTAVGRGYPCEAIL